MLHVDEFGHEAGLAVVVLHGGPGSGCSPVLRRVFDPDRYRIICMDQRGSGRSQPQGETRHNTTADLLADIRLMRERLGIERWLVSGGSWGATLALAHALDEPHAVLGLLMRSSFLARQVDIDDFFAGSHASFAGAPLDASFTRWLSEAMNGADDALRRRTALAWWRHEQSLIFGQGQQARSLAPEGDALTSCINRYRVQSHYLAHTCWLGDAPLLARCHQLPIVPTLLLHGTEDRICPPDGALALHQRLPHATLTWIPGAGHDPTHPGLMTATIDALDLFAAEGRFVAATTASPA